MRSLLIRLSIRSCRLTHYSIISHQCFSGMTKKQFIVIYIHHLPLPKPRLISNPLHRQAHLLPDKPPPSSPSTSTSRTASQNISLRCAWIFGSLIANKHSVPFCVNFSYHALLVNGEPGAVDLFELGDGGDGDFRGGDAYYGAVVLVQGVDVVNAAADSDGEI